MTYQATLSPTGHRIEIIDVIRGFTLFGIALVHMVEQYYAGPPPQDLMSQPSIADGIAMGFVNIFIAGKFFMIFSFLFGLSFHIQFSKSNTDDHFLLRFAWRLLILFGIGLLHHLHYRGDILSIYAILGVGLLLFYKLPDKAILIISILLIINTPSVVVRAIEVLAPSGRNPFDMDAAVIRTYYDTVKSGSYVDILLANLNDFGQKMSFQVSSGRLYITFGLFLLGIYAGRKRYFEMLADNIPFNKKAILNSFFVILASVVVTLITFLAIPKIFEIEISQSVGMFVGGFIYDAFNAALAIIYVAWIVLLFQKQKWRKRLMVLYPVGKMGLTVYLLQTLFGTMIFFSYGLGLLYEIGALYSLLLGFGIFILEILLAHWWFRYFHYGPIEWIWRNLTYLKIQQLTITRA